MKKLLPLSLAFVLLAGASTVRADATCECCKPKATSADDPAVKHPLKGVVRRVNVEKNRISVKHEEIPGFMAAMTMGFTVSPEDVKRVKEGDTITATLSQKGDEWLLEDVQVVGASK